MEKQYKYYRSRGGAILKTSVVERENQNLTIY